MLDVLDVLESAKVVVLDVFDVLKSAEVVDVADEAADRDLVDYPLISKQLELEYL